MRERTIGLGVFGLVFLVRTAVACKKACVSLDSKNEWSGVCANACTHGLGLRE